VPVRTQYARNGDVNIAYQVIGEGVPDLVIVPDFISHLDLDWTGPRLARFLRRIARAGRHDSRGVGRRAIPFARAGALVDSLLALTAACVLLFAGCSADAVARHGASAVSSALDNGTIRVGIDLNAGGSISYLSQSGSSYNLVNIRDKGRYVQQSYYAGQSLDRTSEGQYRPWSPWPWNPIQGGDTYGDPSSVLAWSNNGRTIYVKTRPLLWDMRHEACECDFETRITLEGRTVRVRNKLTTDRTDSLWSLTTSTQELPAVYAIADLDRVLTYVGDRPFSGDSIMQIAGTPSSWNQRWEGTEHWAACVNGQDFGFGVYSPPRTTFVGGLYGSPGGRERDSSTCYLSPLGWAALDKTTVYYYKYFLTVGTLDQIRREVYYRDRILSSRSAPSFR
jgi:hypothetical protein